MATSSKKNASKVTAVNPAEPVEGLEPVEKAQLKPARSRRSSAKGNGRSSKTARVLGLLTSELSGDGKGGSEPSDDQMLEALVRDALEQEVDVGPAPAPKPIPAPQPVILPQFDAEPDLDFDPEPAPEPEPMPEPEPEPVPQPQPQPVPVAQPRPAPAPVAQPVPAAKPVAAKPAPAPAPTVKSAPPQTPILAQSPKSEPDQEEQVICYNAMQSLVEPKADKYIKLFGLCSCPRCHTDVVALALSNLPPQYIAATSTELVPLLSMFEGHYSAAVTSAVINACKKVMANPRHNRKLYSK